MSLHDLLRTALRGSIIVRPGWFQGNSHLVVGEASEVVRVSKAGILHEWTPTEEDLAADDWYAIPVSGPDGDLLPTKE